MAAPWLVHKDELSIPVHFSLRDKSNEKYSEYKEELCYVHRLHFLIEHLFNVHILSTF